MRSAVLGCVAGASLSVAHAVALRELEVRINEMEAGE